MAMTIYYSETFYALYGLWTYLTAVVYRYSGSGNDGMKLFKEKNPEHCTLYNKNSNANAIKKQLFLVRISLVF